jgi:hypothetical protein
MKIRRASRNAPKKHLALVTFLMWFNFLFFKNNKKGRVYLGAEQKLGEYPPEVAVVIHQFLQMLDKIR